LPPNIFLDYLDFKYVGFGRALMKVILETCHVHYI